MSKSKCITKRLLAVVLTVLMLVSMVTIGMASASAAPVELAETGALAAGSKFYLYPGVWETASAKYAVYVWNDGGASAWSDFMTAVEGEDTLYETTLPTGASTWSKIIIMRYSSSATTTGWSNEWNRKGDLELGTDNCYTVTGWGNTDGTWSTYTASGSDDDDNNKTVTGEGLWVDTNPNHGEDSLKKGDVPIDWLALSSTNRFYLPSSVDLDAVEFNYLPADATLKIDGTTVENGGTIALEEGESYTLGGSFSGTFTVLKSANVSTMYTITSEKMPTSTGAYAHKDDYETKGSILVADKDGNVRTFYTPKDEDGNKLDKVTGDATLKKIKGRGNSSWEASYQVFGKYAFNITLDEKMSLIEGANKNKKYCLLANNADEARMRNMVMYSLAETIGVEFVADFEVMDVYNNNKYIGSYLLTEKVEIGDPLVDIVDLDGINEDFFGEDNYGADTYRGSSTGNLDDAETKGYTKYYDYSSLGLGDVDASEYAESGFLLEMELDERFPNEVAGFISSKGQQIVCKYPEYATKAQIEFISDFWNDAEAVIYSDNPTYEELEEYIDVESFAKMYLIQELSKNLDACATSYYVYYDEGKLHAGVTWDYDWTLGQYNYDLSGRILTGDFSDTSGNMASSSGWWANSKRIYPARSNYNIQAQLCQGDDFWNVVQAEWNELFYAEAQKYPESIIEEYRTLMEASIEMDEKKWSFISGDPISSWGNTTNTGDTFGEAVTWLSNYITKRLTWMNDNGLESSTYDIQPPVISVDATEFTEGDTVTLTIKDKTMGDYTYTIYNGTEVVGTGNSFTAAESGSYTVVATSNTTGKTSEASNAVALTVKAACNHVEEEIPAVDPTCTETGLTAGTKCSACGEILVPQDVVAALGHTEVIDAAVEPGCTTTGLTEGKHCSVCDEVFVAQDIVAALGHTEETIAGKDATCTETGLTAGTKCSVCDEVLDVQDVVAALGHTPVTVEGKAPTCTQDGLTSGTVCDVCGEILEASGEIIPATGHTEVIDAAVEPGCTTTGLTEGKHCSVCDEVLVAQDVVAALGHTEVIDAAVEPGCTTTGLTEGKHCSVCDEVFVAQDIVAALGHTEETIAGKDATCTETGLTAGTKCSVCDEVLETQDVVAALGHTEETIAGKDATCTETGLTAGTKCSVCDEVFVTQETIDALGHTWENGSCSVCGTVEVPAEVSGYTITLGGEIGINFYLELSENAIADAGTRVDFTLPNGTVKTVALADATKNADGTYTFTCNVAAKEMTAVVKAQLFTSTGASSEVFKYSVVEYAEEIVYSTNEEYVDAQPLVKAMLNYGAAAQLYFGYNTDNLANDILLTADKVVDEADFENYGYILTGSEDGVKYYGSRLTLEGETIIKHYFYITTDETPEITVNGEAVTAEKVGDLYEVVIDGIVAQDLDGEFEVQIGGLTLNYNAFSYGKLATQLDDAMLMDVMNALYAYNQAANQY